MTSSRSSVVTSWRWGSRLILAAALAPALARAQETPTRDGQITWRWRPTGDAQSP